MKCATESPGKARVGQYATSTCAVNVGVTYVSLRTNLAERGARSSDVHRPSADCTANRGARATESAFVHGAGIARRCSMLFWPESDAAADPTTLGTWPAKTIPRSRARRAIAK